MSAVSPSTRQLAALASGSVPLVLVPALTVMVKEPRRRMSWDEAPSMAPKVPGTSTNACCATSHMEQARSSRGNVTLAEAPASRPSFLKPLSCSGGSRAEGGKPR